MSRLNMEDNLLYDPTFVRGRVKVQQIGSTIAKVPNHGKSVLTSTGAVTLQMEAPVAGTRVVLVKGTTSTAVVTVTGETTTITFNNAGNVNLTFDAADDLIELEGRSTTRWDIIANSNVGVS